MQERIPFMAITYQQVQKTASGKLNVKFPSPFATSNLIVLLSPVWLNQTNQVGFVETVIQGSISSTGCTISSGSFAPNNYFVNVVAIDTDMQQYGDLNVDASSAAKARPQRDIEFKHRLTSPDPVAILTPSWTSGVGYVETEIFSAASEINVASQNMAPNGYYVQCLAADRGRATGPNGVMETGSANKGLYQMRIYFSSAFVNTPVVVVSSWWDKQPNGVGYVETIVNITPNYFEIVSENSGANYFVNWMAFASS
jgi:hypothetical protein